VDILPPKTFVFRWLSQRDSLVIYMLSGAYSPAIAIWRIEGWQNVKKPRKQMLKWSSFFRVFQKRKEIISTFATVIYNETEP